MILKKGGEPSCLLFRGTRCVWQVPSLLWLLRIASVVDSTVVFIVQMRKQSPEVHKTLGSMWWDPLPVLWFECNLFGLIVEIVHAQSLNSQYLNRGVSWVSFCLTFPSQFELGSLANWRTVSHFSFGEGLQCLKNLDICENLYECSHSLCC